MGERKPMVASAVIVNIGIWVRRCLDTALPNCCMRGEKCMGSHEWRE